MRATNGQYETCVRGRGPRKQNIVIATPDEGSARTSTCGLSWFNPMADRRQPRGAAHELSEALFEGEADFVAAPAAIPDGVDPVAVADNAIRAPQSLEADPGADPGEAVPADGFAG